MLSPPHMQVRNSTPRLMNDQLSNGLAIALCCVSYYETVPCIACFRCWMGESLSFGGLFYPEQLWLHFRTLPEKFTVSFCLTLAPSKMVALSCELHLKPCICVYIYIYSLLCCCPDLSWDIPLHLCSLVCACSCAWNMEHNWALCVVQVHVGLINPCLVWLHVGLVYMYGCVCMYMYVTIYACVYVSIYACFCVYVFIYVCVCIMNVCTLYHNSKELSRDLFLHF